MTGGLTGSEQSTLLDVIKTNRRGFSIFLTAQSQSTLLWISFSCQYGENYLWHCLGIKTILNKFMNLVISGWAHVLLDIWFIDQCEARKKSFTWAEENQFSSDFCPPLSGKTFKMFYINQLFCGNLQSPSHRYYRHFRIFFAWENVFVFPLSTNPFLMTVSAVCWWK